MVDRMLITTGWYICCNCMYTGSTYLTSYQGKVLYSLMAELLVSHSVVGLVITNSLVIGCQLVSVDVNPTNEDGKSLCHVSDVRLLDRQPIVFP